MNKDERREAYAKKLRDPRWQRKRLEIMQRDEFTCQYCFDNTATLNVHHNYYLRESEPWDYSDTALVTLCETCHGEESAHRFEEEALLLDVCRRIGLSSSQLNDLALSLYDHGEDFSFLEYWFNLMTWTIRKFHRPEMRGLIEGLWKEEMQERARRQAIREAEEAVAKTEK